MPRRTSCADNTGVHEPSDTFLSRPRAAVRRNKSFLFHETKAVLNQVGRCGVPDERLRSPGTVACPPYHLAVVVGGTSAGSL